jgi:hypothetical protein
LNVNPALLQSLDTLAEHKNLSSHKSTVMASFLNYYVLAMLFLWLFSFCYAV